MGTSVQATTCELPNIARDFNLFAEEGVEFDVFLGTYEATGPVPDPNKDESLLGKEYTVDARFAGRMLTPDGLLDEEELPLSVQIKCRAGWCAGYGDIEIADFLFLRKSETGWVHDVGPCFGLDAPAEPEIVTPILQRCLENKICSDEDVSFLDEFG